MTTESNDSQHQYDHQVSETHTLSVPLGGWWRLALIAAVAFALIFGLVVLMSRIFIPLAMLVFAVVLAEALAPIISWLERFMPRSAAIVTVYVVLILITAGAAFLILPPVVQQISQGVGQLPSEINDLEAYITRRTGLSTDQLSSGLTSVANRFAGQVGSLPLRIVRDLFDVILVYFLSIYWLFVTPSLKRFVISLFPHEKQDTVEDVLCEIGHDMGGYLRGSVISGAITGVLAFVGLMLIHVKYALALGVLTFFGELIPVVGVIAVGALVIVVALFQSFTLALLALAVYTVILFLESHLLAPNIMRSQTTVSQVVVLFALVAGFEVGGVLGALVAIPLSAGIRILVIRVFAPGIRSWTGANSYPEEKAKEQLASANGHDHVANAFKRQNTAAFVTRMTAQMPEPEERLRPEETD